MRYIKTYEKVYVDRPEIDDWAIVHLSQNIDDELNKFIKSNIGKIVDIGYETIEDYRGNQHKSQFYVLNYDTEIPKNIKIWFQDDNNIAFETHEIKYWSKDREDLELIIAANKYNL